MQSDKTNRSICFNAHCHFYHIFPASTDSYPSDDLYVSGPVNFDTFYVIAGYKANAKGEISLTEGQEVEVIEKNDNGELWDNMILH